MKNIIINLGTCPNNYTGSNVHIYYNLTQGQAKSRIIQKNPHEYEFEIHYLNLNPEKDLIPSINLGITFLKNIQSVYTDYKYGDTIKQTLALITLANQLGILSDQDTKGYLNQLSNIYDSYFFKDPEANDLDLPIELGSVNIQILDNDYLISFK